MNLLEMIERTPVAGDGDLSRELQCTGNEIDFSLADEALCLTDPKRVRDAHKAFADVGCSVLRTNTLRANAVFLKKTKFAGRTNELNWTAAQIACEATRGHNVLIAGRVGPLPNEELPPMPKILEIYLEQLGALLDGGARAIVFERFTPGPQLQAALEAKQTLHHCPAIGLCLAGQNPDEFRDTFLEWGGDLVATEIAAAEDSPELFVSHAETALREGASLIFGGKGVSSAHLQLFCEHLRSLNHE